MQLFIFFSFLLRARDQENDEILLNHCLVNGIVVQLGSGAFGSVHYAKYEGNEKSVVIKKLKREGSDAKSRFVREAKMLLCVIYEYYFAQFKLYLVLTRML